MDSNKERKQNNEKAEENAERLAKRNERRRQRRLEETTEERETRSGLLMSWEYASCEVLGFALKLLTVLRQYKEQLLQKRLESRREIWKKSWMAQYEDSKLSGKKRINGKKSKEASRSKLTADF